MSTQTGFIIRGETIREVLESARDAVYKNGQRIATDRGEMQVLHGATVILENIDRHTQTIRDEDRYPHWTKADETWYLRTFVRPEFGPPEDSRHEIIFPFTYAWRSRFHDQGWGHVLKLILLLQNLNYSEVPFTRKEDIDQLVRETYRQFHPDLVLAVFNWLGKQNLQEFLIEPEQLKRILNTTRRDLIKQIGVQFNPSQPHAYFSTIYVHLDSEEILEKTPVYESIHVAPVFDRQQNPVGFDIYHVHHPFYADTVSQLEFAHDLEWGREIAEATGLPLRQIAVFTPRLYLYPETKNHIHSPSLDIQSYLMTNTSGYEPARLDIEQFLGLKNYGRKVLQVLDKLNL